MKRPSAILKESIEHFRSFSSIYLGYSAWILVPTLGIVLLDLLPNSDIAQLVAFVLVITGTIAIVWVSVILIHLAAKLGTEEEVNFQQIQTNSIKEIIPLLIVGFLQLLLYIGGVLLLIFPLFLFIVWYSFAQVSVVLDEKRGMQALAHSKQLVKGNYWYVASGMIGVPALLVLIFATLTGFVVLAIALGTGQNLNILFSLEQEPVWITAINTIGQMFLIPITSIFTTKFYLSFKQEREEQSLEKPVEIG